MKECKKEVQGEINIPDTDYWLKKIGKNFRALMLHTEHGSWAGKPKWQAKPNKYVAQFNKSISGNTPEEVLENLYNELKRIGKIK